MLLIRSTDILETKRVYQKCFHGKKLNKSSTLDALY